MEQPTQNGWYVRYTIPGIGVRWQGPWTSYQETEFEKRDIEGYEAVQGAEIIHFWKHDIQ